MNSSEWREVKLEEIIEIDMGQSPKSEFYNTVGEGLPFLQGNRTFGDIFPTFDTYCTDVKKIAQPLDVIMSVRAPVGDLNYAPEKICIGRGVCAMRMKNSNNKYLFYLLKHNMGTVINRESGTVFGSVNKNDILGVSVKFTENENEQKGIAATLSCLDDKIELNNRMNKNLEDMAQAIFKSWFVDFEPFQDGQFEDSELGMIPKGWRVGTIDELIENTIGGDWGKENEQGNYSEEVVCIRGADIPEIAVGKRGKPPIRFILKKNLEKKQLFKDQIIIEISGGSPTQSTGRTALITDELLEAYKNPLICTNFCRALSFKKKEFSTFVYSLIQYFYKKDILFLYENGTTGIKNLDTGNLFGKHQIIIPDEITFKEYYELYHTLLKSIYDNGIQADKLSTIRDTLLPKLMSGEIRVPIEEVQ